MAVGQNQWYRFGEGAPPILGFILVVGLGCSLGVRDFDPWPYKGKIPLYHILWLDKPRVINLELSLSVCSISLKYLETIRMGSMRPQGFQYGILGSLF